MKKIILLVSIISIIGCGKEQHCECRTVKTHTQHGTNMSHSWEEVGNYYYSEGCNESTTTTTQNMVTTTTRIECISQ